MKLVSKAEQKILRNLSSKLCKLIQNENETIYSLDVVDEKQPKF